MIHQALPTNATDILAATAKARSMVSDLEDPIDRARAILNAMPPLIEQLGPGPTSNSLCTMVTVCEEALERAERERSEILSVLHFPAAA